MIEFENAIKEIFLNYESEKQFFTLSSELLNKEIGFKLLTFTVLHPSHKYTQRIYSSNERVYPTGGKKELSDNRWAEITIKKQKSFIGNNRKKIEKYFFDHKIITSLGCESILNQVVIFDKITIGTINLLNIENHFQEHHLIKTTLFSKFVTPFYLSHLLKMREK